MYKSKCNYFIGHGADGDDSKYIFGHGTLADDDDSKFCLFKPVILTGRFLTGIAIGWIATGVPVSAVRLWLDTSN